MSAIDPALIQKISDDLPRLRAAINATGSTDAIPDPMAVFTNTSLLLQTLGSFFGQSKDARYLPVAVTSHIFLNLAEIDALTGSIATGADDPSPITPDVLSGLLSKLDALYAFCLQYGLISFGFDQKVAQEQLNRLLAKIDEAESAKNVALTAIDSARRIAEERQAGFEGSISEALKSNQAHVELFKEQSVEVGAAVTAAKEALQRIETYSTTASTAQAAITELATATTEGEITITEAANLALSNSKSSEKQAIDAAATAKAEAKAAAETRAGIERISADITKFFADIGLHQQDMLKVKTDAISAANDLQASTTTTMAELTGRTETVVGENEKLTALIKDRLQKAIGISLFGAFDQRRRTLLVVSLIWCAVTVGGTLLAVWVALEFSRTLSVGNVQPSTIIGRLLVAVPVAFLIAFAARQYARERRAQEEYAFKATISVSLEPYRDLMEKMRIAGADVDKEFVKELIRGIFDNPTKRLYPHNELQEPKEDELKPTPPPPPSVG